MSFVWKGPTLEGDRTIRNMDKAFANDSFCHVSSEQALKSFSKDGENVIWTTDLHVELPVRVDSSDCGGMPPETIIEAFSKTVSKYPDEVALYKQLSHNSPWIKWTWKQYWSDVCAFAKSVIQLGVQPRECCCVMGFNAPEWLIAHFGFIFANCVPTGVYTTNNVDSTKYVVDHTQSKIAVVDTMEQVEKFLTIKRLHPSSTIHTIVIYQEQATEESKKYGVINWSDFLKIGKDIPDTELSFRMNSQKPGLCCELVYTSGTTGNPKGVMLSHDNCVWTAKTLQKYINFSPKDRSVSFLPLSHIAAQVSDIYLNLVSGLSLYFAQPDALKGSLVETLKAVQPTFFLAVPRVWEKIYESLMQVSNSTSGLQKKISTWCKEKMYNNVRNKLLYDKDINKISYNVSNLLLSLVKKKLGLNQCRYFATGAAPMPVKLTEYFFNLNIPICDLFGMSECTGPETCSLPVHNAFKIGSIGKPLPSTDIMIIYDESAKTGAANSAEFYNKNSGELVWRGRNVFMGYFKNKAETQKTIDRYGFMRSGDIGIIDQDGFVFITGRAKELLITAGGENVAPVPIEDEIKSALQGIVSNCQLIGDQKKYLAVLLTLKTVPDKDGGVTRTLEKSLVDLLKSKGCNATTTGEADASPIVNKIIAEGLKKVNSKAVSRAQLIQTYRILLDDFSIPGGELGPTLKLKRQVTLQKYAHVVDDMYNNNTKNQLNNTPLSKL